MKYRTHTAFTLVELIVVITVLAILWTLGYISIVWYTKNAKNSVRISDVKSIIKVLELHLTTHDVLPEPDDAQNISYSWSNIWKQWVFSEGSLAHTRKLSHIPLDPSYKLPYAYSVLPSKQYYQLAGIEQKEAILWNNLFIPPTHASKSPWFSSYLNGNYHFYSRVLQAGTYCYILPIPNIFISDIPSGGILDTSTWYSFLENGWSNLPSHYSGASIPIEASTSLFKIDEIWNSCSIDTIEDLDLFIARLSHSFEQMADNPSFERLIYNSHSPETKKIIANQQEKWGVKISKQLLQELNSPASSETFDDSFTNSDGTNLVDTHIKSWSLISGNTWSYIINGNTLLKNDTTNSLISPHPNPAISSANYTVSFELIDFAGWAVEVFLRYVDANNYYKLRVNQGRYQIIRILAGVQSIPQDISETINPGSTIQFGIQWSELIFKVNTIEKEKMIISGIDSIWQVGISLENQNARIDNYVLSYK